MLVGYDVDGPDDVGRGRNLALFFERTDLLEKATAQPRDGKIACAKPFFGTVGNPAHARLDDDIFLQQAPVEAREMARRHRLAVLSPGVVGAAIESCVIVQVAVSRGQPLLVLGRSEEHTSELQSLMRISYA